MDTCQYNVTMVSANCYMAMARLMESDELDTVVYQR